MGKKYLTFIFLGIVAVAFPFLVTSDYYLHLVIIALMWVVIGSSWNLLADTQVRYPSVMPCFLE